MKETQYIEISSKVETSSWGGQRQDQTATTKDFHVTENIKISFNFVLDDVDDAVAVMASTW